MSERPPSASDPQRFADAVRVRRRELGLSMANVAAQGGPSEPTLVRIESGRTPPLRSPTFRKLDRVLSWAPGSARALYNGTGDDELPTDADRPSVANTRGIGLSVTSLAALLELTNSLTSLAVVKENSVLEGIASELRSELSPYVGQAISSVLSSPSEADLGGASRIAQAVSQFMAHPRSNSRERDVSKA